MAGNEVATPETAEKAPDVGLAKTTAERKKAPLTVGAKAMGIVPTDFDQAYRMAAAFMHARMVPNSYKNAEQVLVGIMAGLERGMAPLSALQNIYVVNGTPTIWGDGALALVRNSGFLEHIKEEIIRDADDQPERAVCTVKRKGEPESVVTFTKAQAVRAKLWNKTGPWQLYPERMLQMRARAWALRNAFADVLIGLPILEEAEAYMPVNLHQGDDGTWEADSRVQDVADPLEDETRDAETQPTREEVDVDLDDEDEPEAVA